MQVFATKRQGEICTEKESNRGTSCKSVWIKQPLSTSHISHNELARTSFPVESANNKN